MAPKQLLTAWFVVDEAVRISVSGETLDGRMLELSAAQVKVILNRELEPGAPIKLQWKKTVIVGQGRARRPSGDRFQVTIDALHVVFDDATTATSSARLFQLVKAPGH